MRLGRLVVIVALGGCASAPVVTATREAATGLAPGEAVAVRLVSRTAPDGTTSATPGDQRALAACLAHGMSEAVPGLALAEDAQAPGVRYVVELRSRTSVGDKQWQVAGERGGGAIARTWKETAELSAEVVDLRHQRVALRAEASATGEEGRGVMVVLIIPVPLVYWSSTERKACEALGRRLPC